VVEPFRGDRGRRINQGVVFSVLGCAAGCSILVGTSGLSGGEGGSSTVPARDDSGSGSGGGASGSSGAPGGGADTGTGSGSGSGGGSGSSSGDGSSGSSSGSGSTSSSGSGGGSDSGGGGECVPGSRQCAGNATQTCDSSGEWQTGTTCPVACCDGACSDTNDDPNNCGTCGSVCGTGYQCGTGFTAFTGTQPAGWTANGNAIYDGADDAAQLTDLNGNEAGSWIYDNAIAIDSLTIQFDFFIGGGPSGQDGDGMGMILETDGDTAVGADSLGLGITGLTGFGVEIDEFDNGSCGDSNSNHIGIDSLALCDGKLPNTLGVNNSPGITVDDGNWHTMIVGIVSGAFSVTADGNSEFAGFTPAGWSNGSYYFGFAGATGGFDNFHRVRNVRVSFTNPHCY
jgi:hypothetical protein